jgi:hypothetical protein
MHRAEKAGVASVGISSMMKASWMPRWGFLALMAQDEEQPSSGCDAHADEILFTPLSPPIYLQLAFLEVDGEGLCYLILTMITRFGSTTQD